MLAIAKPEYKITHQHTYLFPETGESITVYVSDRRPSLFGLSFSHKQKDIKWAESYEEMLQLQSQVNPLIWYIYLSAYWVGGPKSISIERVMMVKDCNASHYSRQKEEVL